MGLFVGWLRSQSYNPLLPRLKALRFELQEGLGPYIPAPCSLPLLDVLSSANITSLNLTLWDSYDRKRVMMPSWIPIRAIVDQKLRKLLSQCRLEVLTVIVNNDLLPSIVEAVDHANTLRGVDLRIVRHLGPMCRQNVDAFLEKLTKLPNLHSIALHEPPMRGIWPGGNPEYPVPTAPNLFSALRTVHAAPHRVLGYIPHYTHDQLSSLSLELDIEYGDIDNLAECLAGCAALQDLTLWVTVGRLPPGGGTDHLPWMKWWRTVWSFKRLESFAFMDVLGNLLTPSDWELESMARSCPALQSVKWHRGSPPGADGPPFATLKALRHLATCPITSLDIPLFVGAPCSEPSPCRYSTSGLKLGYRQWMYTSVVEAEAWIEAFLKTVCPAKLRVTDWIKIEHDGHTRDDEWARDVRAMWCRIEGHH